MTPNLTVDPAANVAYLSITKNAVKKTIELQPGKPQILADVDVDGNIVGIEILGFK